MWHQAGGPDVVNNGLALCVLHHKLFDRGAFTVGLDHRVQVSELVHGTTGFNEWVLGYHEKDIAEPVNVDYAVADRFLRWHGKEVFRGRARLLSA
ncbi:HNH endonuclease [Planctomycetota bacterium]